MNILKVHEGVQFYTTNKLQSKRFLSKHEFDVIKILHSSFFKLFLIAISLLKPEGSFKPYINSIKIGVDKEKLVCTNKFTY